MTNQQAPEALRLAAIANSDGHITNIERNQIARELRRLHAENERLAAQQPAPSAAAAPVAVKAMGYGGSTGVNDYLMSDGTVKAMRPAEVKWAPQPSPTPQADSQPAPPELLKFYGVTTDAELIAAQARHIERLQAKLPQTPSFAPQRVREG